MGQPVRIGWGLMGTSEHGVIPVAVGFCQERWCIVPVMVPERGDPARLGEIARMRADVAEATVLARLADPFDEGLPLEGETGPLPPSLVLLHEEEIA